MKQVIILVAMITLGLLLFIGVQSLGSSGSLVAQDANEDIESVPLLYDTPQIQKPNLAPILDD